MGIEDRLNRLEQRHRNRVGADGPLTYFRADYDAAGHVIACEGMTVPLKPPNPEGLGPMVAGMLAMVREPNSRASCPYDGCEKRDTCRADGRLTNQQSVNSSNS